MSVSSKIACDGGTARTRRWFPNGAVAESNCVLRTTTNSFVSANYSSKIRERPTHRAHHHDDDVWRDLFCIARPARRATASASVRHRRRCVVCRLRRHQCDRMAPQLPALTRAARAALLHGPYLIVNEGTPDPVDLARVSLRAGICVVQYRAKRGIDDERLHALRAV